MNRIAITGLVCGLGGALAGYWMALDNPAQAQAYGGTAVEMTATAVGGVSHAYAVDTRMAQVIFCRAGAAEAKPVCATVPVPGTAQR